MQTIRLLLEYSCEPVWIYGENGLFGPVIGVGFPEEIKDNKELDDLMWKISRQFDSQYINNKHEFTAVGFKNKEEEKAFKRDLVRFGSMIKEALKPYKDKYKIVDDFDYDDFKG